MPSPKRTHLPRSARAGSAGGTRRATRSVVQWRVSGQRVTTRQPPHVRAGIAGRPPPTGSHGGPRARAGCARADRRAVSARARQGPAARGISYSSIRPRSANARGSVTPPTHTPSPGSCLSRRTACRHVALHQLGIPVDLAQRARHDVLLRPVDGLGERNLPLAHPVGPCACGRPPPRRLHHLVGHPAEQQGVGSFHLSGPVTHRLLVRGEPCLVMAAAVERDVDRVAKRSHPFISLVRTTRSPERTDGCRGPFSSAGPIWR